jgi:hypothetical protein
LGPFLSAGTVFFDGLRPPLRRFARHCLRGCLDPYVASRTNVSYRTQQYGSSDTPAVLVEDPGM